MNIKMIPPPHPRAWHHLYRLLRSAVWRASVWQTVGEEVKFSIFIVFHSRQNNSDSVNTACSTHRLRREGIKAKYRRVNPSNPPKKIVLCNQPILFIPRFFVLLFSFPVRTFVASVVCLHL